MDKTEVLLKIMEMTKKIVSKDATVIDEINLLSSITLEEDTKQALASLENNLVFKVVSDDELASFLVENFSGVGKVLVNVDYINTMAKISGTGINKEDIKSYIESGKEFGDNYRNYAFFHALSNGAISSGDYETITITLNKLDEINKRG